MPTKTLRPNAKFCAYTGSLDFHVVNWKNASSSHHKPSSRNTIYIFFYQETLLYFSKTTSKLHHFNVPLAQNKRKI